MSAALNSFLLFAVLFTAQATPNISGTWRLDHDASTGEPAAKGAYLLIITQSGDDITFDYYAGSNGQRGQLIQSSYVKSDGTETRGNKIRTYVTYVRAYWQRKTLIVQTKGVLDLDGYQTFTTEDRWSVSPDGKTLTALSSDGKKTVYTRQPDQAP